MLESQSQKEMAFDQMLEAQKQKEMTFSHMRVKGNNESRDARFCVST